MLRSSSGVKIAALLENGKNHAAGEHHSTAFARASPASTKGGRSLPAQRDTLSLPAAPSCPQQLSPSPQTPPPLRPLSNTPSSQGWILQPMEKGHFHVCLTCCYTEKWSQTMSRKKNAPCSAWPGDAAVAPRSPEVLFPCPLFMRVRPVLAGWLEKKKKGYASSSWLRMLVSC